jgi:hypothetical protein
MKKKLLRFLNLSAYGSVILLITLGLTGIIGMVLVALASLFM